MLSVEEGKKTLRERENMLVLVEQLEEIFRREKRGKEDVERLVSLIEDSYGAEISESSRFSR